MAETDRPCRCRSKIMTTSPSLITVPSPPACGDSIDDRFAADLPGLAPGGRASPRAWGEFKRHFWGRSLRHQHEGHAEPWLDLAEWDEGAQDIALEDIDPGARCWIGVDLSAT